jgi:hypothetical protein
MRPVLEEPDKVGEITLSEAHPVKSIATMNMITTKDGTLFIVSP